MCVPLPDGTLVKMWVILSLREITQTHNQNNRQETDKSGKRIPDPNTFIETQSPANILFISTVLHIHMSIGNRYIEQTRILDNRTHWRVGQSVQIMGHSAKLDSVSQG